jgi:hypothetical protein
VQVVGGPLLKSCVCQPATNEGSHGQRFAIDDGDVDALVGVQLGEIVHQHFGATGLAVDVDQQNLAAAVGKSGR